MKSLKHSSSSCKITLAINQLIIFVVLAFSIQESALAYSYQGTVSNVYANGGLIHVIVSAGSFDSGNSGPCLSLSGNGVYSIDPATSYGRAMVAIAITAKATGRLVWVAGNGTCTSAGGTAAESLVSIDLKG